MPHNLTEELSERAENFEVYTQTGEIRASCYAATERLMSDGCKDFDEVGSLKELNSVTMTMPRRRRFQRPKQTRSALYLLIAFSFCLQCILVAAKPIASLSVSTKQLTVTNAVTLTSEKQLKAINGEESLNAYCKCPHENYNGVAVIGVVPPGGSNYNGSFLPPSKDGYNVGDTLIHSCNVAEADIVLFDNNNKLEDLLVYHSAYRTCQPDCTLSGHPPICLDLSKPANRRKISISKTTNCWSGPDCHLGETEEWVKVGDSIEQKRESNYTRIFKFQFSHSLYVHIMRFNSFCTNGSSLGKIDAELKVKRRALVANLSQKINMISPPDQLELPGRKTKETLVYTGEAIVRVYYDGPTSVCNPKLEFYAVPEAGMQGLKGGKCPSPPVIANAYSKVSENRMKVEYYCKEGYQLKDPLRNELSSGILRCLNGFHWDPYPLPVCYRISNTSIASSTDQEEDLSNLRDSYPMPPFLYPNLLADSELEYPTTPSSRVIHVDMTAFGGGTISGFAVGLISTLSVCLVIFVIIWVVYVLWHHCFRKGRTQRLSQEPNDPQHDHGNDFPLLGTGKHMTESCTVSFLGKVYIGMRGVFKRTANPQQQPRLNS